MSALCLHLTHVIIVSNISHLIIMVTRASRSYWSIMVLMIMVHHTMAGIKLRTKRQIEDFSSDGGTDRQDDTDLVEAATNFIDELEQNLLTTLDTLIEDQEAQDRVLLEDVQVIETGTEKSSNKQLSFIRFLSAILLSRDQNICKIIPSRDCSNQKLLLNFSDFSFSGNKIHREMKLE